MFSGKLPALKLQPHTLPLGSLLEAISNGTGDYRKIEDNVYDLWVSTSTRKKSPERRNSLRAVVGPTLRHLDVVRGDGNEFRLNGTGERLLEVYLKGGEASLKKELATHLVRLDEECWINVLVRLEKAGGQLSLMDLIQQLGVELPDSKIDRDKLRKYLKFFEYTDLISINDRCTKIELKSLQLKAARTGSFKILSPEEFANIMVGSYAKIRERTNNPLVAIPDLRDAVTRETGLFSFDFDRLLSTMPRETKDYILQFSQPMTRRQGGLQVGNIYMYYVAIYPGRR